MTSTDPPWEQRPDESSKAYQAFATYRDAGVDRSIRGTGRTLGKSRAVIETWSVRHGWVARVGAWDREQDRLARVAAQRGRDEMNRRHAQLGAAILGKVAQGLVALQATAVKPADLARLADVGAKLERTGRGEPDRVEVTGPAGGAVPIEATVVLDPATLQEILREQAELETARMVQLERARAQGTVVDDE